jgi:hypothetical protein
MAEEGIDYIYTPFSFWLSHCLNKIHKNGGKVKLLSEYQKQKEQSENDIITRLNDFQSN